MAKKQGKKSVSQDTDVTYANANKEVNIFGDLAEFDVNSWGGGSSSHDAAEAFLIGGTVDGNNPFNVYEIEGVSGLSSNWHGGELQKGVGSAFKQDKG